MLRVKVKIYFAPYPIGRTLVEEVLGRPVDFGAQMDQAF